MQLINCLLFCTFVSLFFQHKAEIVFLTAAQLKESFQMRATIVTEEIARLQAMEPATQRNQELLKELYTLHWKLQLDLDNIDSYMRENSQQEEILPLARGSTSHIFAASDTPSENQQKSFSKWSFFNRLKNSNQPLKSQSTANFPYTIETGSTNYAPMQQQSGAASSPIILSPQQLSELGSDQNYFFVAPPLTSENTNTRPSFLNRIVSFFRPTDHNINQLKIQPGAAHIPSIGQNIGSYLNLDGTADMTVVNANDFLHRLIQHRNNLDNFIKKLQAERNE